MTLLITSAGIAAAKRADNMGLDCKITHIAIGRGGYVPNKNQTQLQDEITRKAITRATSPEVGQLHFEVQFDGDLSYEAKEIGYFFEDGTLFAVDSRDGEIISIKRTDSIVVEAFELNLADSEIQNVTVALLDSPYATQSIAGIVKISNSFTGKEEGTAVSELALSSGLAEKVHHGTVQFTLYDPDRIYFAGDICYTNSESESTYWQWYSNIESKAGINPLDPSNRHIEWSASDKPFYWIEYTANITGMPFFWLDTQAPEWAVMEINVNLPVVVYWRLARRYPHLVRNGFINTGEIRGEFIRVLDQGRGVDSNRQMSTYQPGTKIVGDTGHVDSHGITIYNINSVCADPIYEKSETFETRMQYTVTTQFIDDGIPFFRTVRPRNVARAMAIAI